MNPKVITQPIAEPISLEEARGQCRVEAYGTPAAHPDDLMIEIYISAAREWVESYTGVAMCPQTLELSLDAFPASTDPEIEITRGPVRAITSVKYADESQVERTLSEDAYALDTFSDRIWLLPAAESEWPTAGAFANAVKIRYEAGYDIPGGSPQDNPLPRAAKVAMLLLVGHLYRNREATIERALAEVPLGVCSFLDGIRVRQGFA
jgi:uncharacterized phiE125 gp8 family phage protein